MKQLGIYAIKNEANGKLYIGSSRNIVARWRVHASRLRLNKHHSQHLQLAFNIAPLSFKYEIVELLADPSLLEVREQYWVDHYQSFKSEFGYNAVQTVSILDPNRMRERWAKPGAKEKQSQIMKKVCSTKEHRKKLSDGHIEYYSKQENRDRALQMNKLKKAVRHVETGKVYLSINQAAKALGVSIVKIRDNATGKRPARKGLSFEWA